MNKIQLFLIPDVEATEIEVTSPALLYMTAEASL